MAPTWTIYCHTHAETGRHYVGLTKKTMEARWKDHIHSSKKVKRQHFGNAVRKHGEHAFEHHVLETCESLQDANAAERRWIALLGTQHPSLGFNLMEGGLHIPHPIRSPWERPEYREKQKCRRLSEEARANLSRLLKERYADPEFKRRQTEASREVHSRPEVREKLIKSSRGRVFGPEARANNSRAQKGKPGRVFSEESLAKISSSLKGNRNSVGRRHSPELKKMIGEGVRKARLARQASVKGD